MAYIDKIKKLCSPAFIYFIVSMISILIIFLQNLGHSSTIYSVGSYSSRVQNTTIIFIGKILYVLIWTWLLNKFCKSGYSNISWFLVLFPYILFLVIIGLILLGMFSPYSYMG